MSNEKLAEALRQILDATGGYVPNTSKVIWRNAQEALQAHAAEAAQAQPAQDAKLPSDEDFRLHFELTPVELRVAQAAFRYAMAKESGR